jgi:transposase InsO family protein
MLQRQQQGVQKSQQFIDKAEALRADHPEMGCRKMALKLKQPGSGRDKTEALLLRSGFRVIYPPNYIKTTHSVRIRQFGNLIEGLVVTSINKVVQTDITYLWVKDRFYYLVLMIDVYSRVIVGYHVSCGLEAEANIQALRMMIKLRGKENLKGLIHHSDRGSQYNCKKYLAILKEHGIKVSMCKEAWENAYTERINRTIKHEYLRHKKIESLQSLKKEMSRTVKLYNNNRPHWSLVKQMPPAVFEEYVNKLSKTKRPKVVIYKAGIVLSTK